MYIFGWQHLKFVKNLVKLKGHLQSVLLSQNVKELSGTIAYGAAP